MNNNSIGILLMVLITVGIVVGILVSQRNEATEAKLDPYQLPPGPSQGSGIPWGDIPWDRIFKGRGDNSNSRPNKPSNNSKPLYFA